MFYFGYNLKNNILPNILQGISGPGNILSVSTAGQTRTPDPGLSGHAIQHVRNGNEASGFIPNIEEEQDHGLNRLYSNHNYKYALLVTHKYIYKLFLNLCSEKVL